MRNMRLLFQKDGLGRYISHLDLVRTMQRVFVRAGVAIRHTEGFNPHPYMNFALPLPVGTDSVCELMDFTLLDDTLAEEELCRRLNGAMPGGIRVLQAYEPRTKLRELKWLRVTGELVYDRPVPEAAEALQRLFAAPSLVIRKKTKRGMADCDIRPGIREISLRQTDACRAEVEAVLSAAEPSLSPAHLMAAAQQLCPALAPDFSRFTRREIYDSNGIVFR